MSTENHFECNCDSAKGLKYKDLSIIYMQIFTLKFEDLKKHIKTEKFMELDPESKKYMVEVVEEEDKEESIDNQIFIYGANKNLIRRYKLPNFTVIIQLIKPYPVRLECEMHVEMSLFFNQTISMTYRMVIDDEIQKSSEFITTDHIISLISLASSAEHWHMKEGDVCSDAIASISGKTPELSIKNLVLNSDGAWSDDRAKNCGSLYTGNHLIEVFDRYRERVRQICGDSRRASDGKKHQKFEETGTIYTYVDIWESLQHYDGLFEEMVKENKEEDIISHIAKYHKKELVGLMSLYPAEWPYRTIESFDDICGENAAIDTDDLIYVGHNVCVVLGTYGLRGGVNAPTKWKEILNSTRKKHHVSWPEYMLILEMILAKKHTIEYANDYLLESVISENAFENPTKSVEENAKLNLNITKLISKLDAVKYSKFVSHKVMFDKTSKRLRINEARAKLDETIERLDNSLNTIRDAESLKLSSGLKNLLAIISIISLAQIVFNKTEIPFLEFIGVNWHNIFAVILEMMIAIFILGSVIYFFVDKKVRRSRGYK